MSKSDSTRPGFADKSEKPSKPYPEFPLFPHATKRWAKKIRGKMRYFGPWEDPDGALAKYNAEKDDLHAGRKPREDRVSEGVTVKMLANAFLNHKQEGLAARDLSPRTWENYRETAELVVAHFGKSRLVADLRPDDFAELRTKLAKTWGPVRVGNKIQEVRSVFKYGYDSELLAVPVRFGPGFKRPSKKTLRLNRAEKRPRMFEADELRQLIEAASLPLRAMILLGVNCGFGNSDCGTLPLAAVDLDGGWISYHRPKTGINRRCPLWPETVTAIQAALAVRPEPRDPAHTGLAFITKQGLPWAKDVADSPITKETRKLLDALGLEGNRNFYALRHTFETIGGEAKDQVAVDHIMGHARDDMASVYRERISDERLKAVSEWVRQWMFGKEEEKRPGAAAVVHP